jgi:hypothetical protein
MSKFRVLREILIIHGGPAGGRKLHNVEICNLTLHEIVIIRIIS